MTRLIVLELAEDTTDTECGGCVYATLDPVLVSTFCSRPEFEGPIEQLVVPFPPPTRGSRVEWMRRADCIAAEQRAERMVEIAPEDAALDEASLSCPVDPHRDAMLNAAWDRITEALREHGRKAMR